MAASGFALLQKLYNRHIFATLDFVSADEPAASALFSVPLTEKRLF
jgi:hypothetical protein